MRNIVAALILACAAAPAWSQQAGVAVRGEATARARTIEARPQTMVWGQVRSEKSGAPLRYAIVEIITHGLHNVAATTDSNGVYVLRDVPAGRRLLRVTHIDHAPNEIEILIVPEKQHTIDFDLQFRPVRLATVLAEGSRGLAPAIDTVSLLAPDIVPATVRALESGAGVAELGMQDAARDVPGREEVDPEDVLYVRGGAEDLKLVLLNGAPVYAPFHIGGLINALDADVLRSADLYVGGAPARYDGGLSYVMDMETRSGRAETPHGELGLDMMSGRALLEGPVGDDASLLVSTRAVHGAGPRALLRADFPYAYGDALGRADYVLSPHHVLTLTGFWNHERVDLDSIGTRPQSASWGNHAGSLRYRGRVRGNEMLGTVAVGRFRTLLPLGGIRPLTSEGSALRTRVGLDVERPLAGGRVFWGGSFERIAFDYRAYEQAGDRNAPIVSSHADGDVTGVYGEAAFTIAERVRVRGGMRADHFSVTNRIELAPRLAATVLITDDASLTLSGGRYRQYVRASERSLSSIGSVPDSATGATLSVAEASHLVLGLAQNFGEGVRLGLDGYFKQFNGIEANDDVRTHSSGVDLWLRRNSGTFTGWLGYSLSWVWKVEADNRDSDSFRGRHLINAGVSGPVVGRGLFDVRVSYGAGLPYTAIPEPEMAAPSFARMDGGDSKAAVMGGGTAEGGALSTEPNEPYIRVDAQVSRPFSGSVRNFDFEVVPYVRVINALNRRDAIFYHYSSDAGRAEPLADLPVLPVVGLEWKF